VVPESRLLKIASSWQEPEERIPLIGYLDLDGGYHPCPERKKHRKRWKYSKMLNLSENIIEIIRKRNKRRLTGSNAPF